MSYRVWWLIALWALAVGIAVELQSPGNAGRDEAQATARALPPPVATQPAARPASTGRG
jgi:hypothetical protein